MGFSHKRMEYVKHDLKQDVMVLQELHGAHAKKSKMRRIHNAADKVVLGGVPLKNSFNFKYLEFEYQSNGFWRHAVNVWMVLAWTRFGNMYHIWNSTQLSLEVKL